MTGSPALLGGGAGAGSAVAGDGRRPTRRATTQIERALQQEVMLRLSRFPVIALPIPNSMSLSGLDHRLAARIVAQMKQRGILVPGAPDLVVLWHESRYVKAADDWYETTAAGLIELKRPATADLLTKRPAGRPSEAQRAFADRAAELGINHAFCSSWDEVRAALLGWGAPVE